LDRQQSRYTVVRKIGTTAWAGILAILICGCSPFVLARNGFPALAPTSAPATVAPTATPILTGKLTTCSDPISVVNAFYDANDAGQFDKGLAFFSDSASLHTWAQGLYGDRMEDKQVQDRQKIRASLGAPGFQLSTGKPDAPIYYVSEAKASVDKLTYYLRPDRLDPSGRPYNPFQVNIQFEGCKFKTMTVIEIISWV
jgi:hypothetical protein